MPCHTLVFTFCFTTICLSKHRPCYMSDFNQWTVGRESLTLIPHPLSKLISTALFLISQVFFFHLQLCLSILTGFILHLTHYIWLLNLFKRERLFFLNHCGLKMCFSTATLYLLTTMSCLVCHHVVLLIIKWKKTRRTWFVQLKFKG